MAGTVRYYASVPNAAALCCIVAKIDPTEVQDSSAKSDFHWKTMKCRLIINTMKDAVIAYPGSANDGSVYVIVGVEFFKTGVLQNCLKEINMTRSMPRPVTRDIYANCLRYSILFVLAPRWNRVGEFLVLDREFLTIPKNTAMRFDLNFESRRDKSFEARLRLQPLEVKLSDLTLERLDLPEEIIARFMADPNGIIDIEYFGNRRVTVLPSLKRGKLIAVLRKMPASSNFKNYGELRRHWKNMYGYRLPETDNGLFYYVVYFPMTINDHFLYPNICLRYQIEESPYFGNRDLFVKNFIRDIDETLPMICGESLRFIAEEEKIEDSSFVAASRRFDTKNGEIKDEESRKSPEMMRNEANTDVPSTTRLSLFPTTPQNCRLSRALSTLMSPTPSLRGTLGKDETRSDKSRGIPTTIAKFRESTSSTGFSRIKSDNSAETQNRCPNIGKTDGKTVPMDIDTGTSRYEKKATLGSHNNAETKIIIKNSEIVSKYFDESGKSNKKSDPNISQNSGKGTLREKLLRNTMRYDEN